MFLPHLSLSLCRANFRAPRTDILRRLLPSLLLFSSHCCQLSRMDDIITSKLRIAAAISPPSTDIYDVVMMLLPGRKYCRDTGYFGVEG